MLKVKMGELDEFDMEAFGRLVEGSEKMITILGDRWRSHTNKQEGDKIRKQFILKPRRSSIHRDVWRIQERR